MTTRTESLRRRLQEPRPVLLDGATGTELGRRGVDLSPPLWSAHALLEAPDVLRQVHRDYIEAGAEVVTANTFRTHARSLRPAGLAGRAAELTETAVRLAREAADDRALVVGSQAPLEDCYSPHLVPEDAALECEHAEMARHLARAGVDGILVETQNTVREAVAATRAAAATGLPVLVSFVCGADGRLLSGERLGEAVRAVLPFRPVAVLVNCAPAPDVSRMLEELAEAASGLPFGAYANVGRLDPHGGWQDTDAVDPLRYAEYVRAWVQAGARLVGGCCGTTPEHIRRVRRVLDEFQAA